jgi:nitrite reductase/ring-hydroxylating ferredoxin subunit
VYLLFEKTSSNVQDVTQEVRDERAHLFGIMTAIDSLCSHSKAPWSGRGQKPDLQVSPLHGQFLAKMRMEGGEFLNDKKFSRSFYKKPSL